MPATHPGPPVRRPGPGRPRPRADQPSPAAHRRPNHNDPAPNRQRRSAPAGTQPPTSLPIRFTLESDAALAPAIPWRDRHDDPPAARRPGRDRALTDRRGHRRHQANPLTTTSGRRRHPDRPAKPAEAAASPLVGRRPRPTAATEAVPAYDTAQAETGSRLRSSANGTCRRATTRPGRPPTPARRRCLAPQQALTTPQRCKYRATKWLGRTRAGAGSVESATPAPPIDRPLSIAAIWWIAHYGRRPSSERAVAGPASEAHLHHGHRVNSSNHSRCRSSTWDTNQPLARGG